MIIVQDPFLFFPPRVNIVAIRCLVLIRFQRLSTRFALRCPIPFRVRTLWVLAPQPIRSLPFSACFCFTCTPSPLTDWFELLSFSTKHAYRRHSDQAACNNLFRSFKPFVMRPLVSFGAIWLFHLSMTFLQFFLMTAAFSTSLLLCNNAYFEGFLERYFVWVCPRLPIF